ncbi:MAG: DUF3048 domain-containing protein [bacterium]|nr:DUF3048 domain-containing protein [bacterium]
MPLKEPRRAPAQPPKPSRPHNGRTIGGALGVTAGIAAALIGGLLFVVLGASFALLSGQPRPISLLTFDPATLAQPPVELPPALRAGDTPLAVMIENHIAARPAAGLQRARVVYEAPAEGGITRYLAIFSLQDLPARIGPVRSVRPYFAAWAAEWEAALFHSGGSPAALSQLRASPLPNIDEISAYGRYYWRDSDRERPHNLYTSDRLIRQAFENLGLPRQVAFTPFPQVADGETKIPTEDVGVVVTADDPDYCAGYRWNAEVGAYERWLGGLPQRTEDGSQLYAKNVLLLTVSARVLDREGRLKLELDGDGSLTALVDGRTVAGKWRRNGAATQYFAADGGRLRFADGPLWITVVTDAAAIRHLPEGAGEDAMSCR